MTLISQGTVLRIPMSTVILDWKDQHIPHVFIPRVEECIVYTAKVAKRPLGNDGIEQDLYL